MGRYPDLAVEGAMKVQEVITRAASGQLTWWQAAEILAVRTGDVATPTMIADLKGTFMGKPMPPRQRSTDFFVKRDGRWQALSTQNTTIT